MWRWIFALCATLVCTIDAQAFQSTDREMTDSMYVELFQYAMKDGFPDKAIDMDKLVRKYTEICPYLSECDRGHLKDPAPVTYQRSTSSILACKPCGCFPACINSGSCCPMSPYQYFRYQSANKIIKGGKSRQPSTNYFISHCPAWYDEDKFITTRCVGNDSILYPVTSLTTLLSYRNKYCAACHNDTDLYPWPLDTICYVGAKVTLMSDTQDILKDNDCWQEFYGILDLSAPVQPVVSLQNNGIGTCNVTGFWTDYDDDVNWMCEHMTNSYLGFKNVFCYICNPGILETQQQQLQLIDSCNVTGNWLEDIPEVAHNCLSLPQTKRLFPFKNIHCMICNGMNSFTDGDYFRSAANEDATTATVNISLVFSPDDAWNSFHEITHIINQSGIRTTTSVHTGTRESLEDVPYLLQSYESICGGKGNRSNTHAFANCHCQDSIEQSSSYCFQIGGTCSPAMLLKYNPIECVSFQSVPSWKSNAMNGVEDTGFEGTFALIDRCLTDEGMSEYFQSFSAKVSYDGDVDIPIRISNGAVFKNLSYWLCNTNRYFRRSGYLNMELHCNAYIDYSLYISLKDLLYTAKNHCNIYFISSGAKPCKRFNADADAQTKFDARAKFNPTRNISSKLKNVIESTFEIRDTSTYTKCNETKKWTQEHMGIRLACESGREPFASFPPFHMDGSTYKNFACFICNPILGLAQIDDVISTCNATGAWTVDGYRKPRSNEELCAQTEYHERWLPFKNFFCSECNLPDGCVVKKPDVGPTFRQIKHLTSISEAEWMVYLGSTKASTPRLNGKNNTSKALVCSDGHILNNGSCLANYEDSELTYKLSFGLKLDRLSNVSTTGCQMPQNHLESYNMNLATLIEQIHEHISDEVQQAGFYIKGYYLNGTVNTACEGSQQEFVMTVLSKISFSFVFGYIAENVTDLETMLLRFLDSDYVVKDVSGAQTDDTCLLLQTTEQWYHSPNIKTPPSNVDLCHHSTELDGIRFMLPYAVQVASVVDRFILCPQYEFGPHEYLYHNMTDTVTISADSVVLKSGYFKRHGTAIRVCADDYREILTQAREIKEPAQPLIKYLHTFSYVVNGISLTCLAITFVSHGMLLSLHGLPGKNIMLLTFCLFCTQALLVFTNLMEQCITACQVLGIFIHYFWLATFFATNVCSYHLFKIVLNHTGHKDESLNDFKQFAIYLLYTIGLPLAIVTTTACIYGLSSDWQTVGYRSAMWFLSDITASIVAFMIPASTAFSFNVLFFGLALQSIHVVPSAKPKTKDVLICFKINAIISITWPLCSLDSSIGLSYFSFVVEGINALQGLLFFHFLVCSKGLLAHLKATFHQTK